MIKEKNTALRKFIRDTLILVIGASILYFGAWLICSSFVWEPEDFLYRMLKPLQMLAPFFVLFLWLMRIVLLFVDIYHQNRKKEAYFEEVLEAMRGIYDDSSEMVHLSPALKNIENQMNDIKLQVREKERIAREAEQRKNDLVVYLAHDLKTPLTSVIGYLSLLYDEKEISGELQEKYRKIALDKAERLEDLINEFFEITRFNLTNQSLEIGKINFSRMLSQIVFEFGPMFGDKHLTCKLQQEPDMMLTCDAEKLERVFENLLRNAVNYSYENTEIQVWTEQQEHGLLVHIKNQGNTIPPEKLERIFEQFYRLDSARGSRSGGAGLGLAIAKEIVQLHGGTITAASQNQEIEFVVELPIS